MAKAKAIRELDCTADAREWAKKVLHVRFGEVAARRDSALDFSDVGGVHDMRVAATRLRSAMLDACDRFTHRLKNTHFNYGIASCHCRRRKK